MQVHCAEAKNRLIISVHVIKLADFSILLSAYLTQEVGGFSMLLLPHKFTVLYIGAARLLKIFLEDCILDHL